jgi:archaellum component FlaC
MSTSALENFVKKYQTAKSYNSKEIRLTLHDAEELSTAIALILANVNTLSEKIIQLQDQLLQTSDITAQNLIVSGGKF